MANVANIIARIGANIRPLQQGLRQAQRDVSQFQRDMSRALKGINDQMILASTAVAAGFTMMAKSSVQAAMKYESSLNQIGRIMGNSSKDFINWTETQANQFNMSKLEAMQYGATFGNLITTITSDTKQISTYTQQLLKASAIVASGTGREITDVMERIRSGLLGNTESIEDLSINVNVAMLESTAAFKKFANGQSWDKLSFQTQQQIRLFAILEQATKKYGNEISQSTSSSLSKLSSIMKDVNLQIGEILLPIVQEILPILNMMAAGIKSLVTAFSKLNPTIKYIITFGAIATAVIIPVLVAVAGFIVLVTAAFEGLTVGIITFAAVAIAAFAALGGVFGATIGNKAQSMLDSFKEKMQKLKQASAGTAKEQKDLGKEIKKTGDKTKGALMPFDEINQLQEDLAKNTEDASSAMADMPNSFDNVPSVFNKDDDKNKLPTLVFPPIEPPTIPPPTMPGVLESFQTVIDKIKELAGKRNELAQQQPIGVTANFQDNLSTPLNSVKTGLLGSLLEMQSATGNFEKQNTASMNTWKTGILGSLQNVKLGHTGLLGSLAGVSVGSENFVNQNVPVFQGWKDDLNLSNESVKTSHQGLLGSLVGLQTQSLTFQTENVKTMQEWQAEAVKPVETVKTSQEGILVSLASVQKESQNFKTNNVQTFQEWQKENTKPIQKWNEETSTGFKGWVDTTVVNMSVFASKSVGFIAEFSKNSWKSFSTWLSGTASGVYSWVTFTFNQIVTWGKSVFTVIDGLARSVGKSISNSIQWSTNIALNAFQGIGDWADKNKDWLIPTAIGAAAVGTIVATGGLAAIPEALAAGGLLAKTVPAFATGGIVTGPTLAMIGEGNGPEAVLPLTGGYIEELGSMIGTSVIQAMQFNNSQSRSAGDIILQIDGTQFARIINPYTAKENQRIGNKMIIQGV